MNKVAQRILLEGAKYGAIVIARQVLHLLENEISEKVQQRSSNRRDNEMQHCNEMEDDW